MTLTLPARAFLLTAIFAATAPLHAEETSESVRNLKAYPQAEAGFKRHVIHLPGREDEQSVKVEIIAGQQQTVDCNHHWYGGNLKTGTVQGWGYDFHTLEASEHAASTLMGCLSESEHEAFVPVRGDGFLLRYNSRLPLVIYAPERFEVRYRLWQASDETHTAKVE